MQTTDEPHLNWGAHALKRRVLVFLLAQPSLPRARRAGFHQASQPNADVYLQPVAIGAWPPFSSTTHVLSSTSPERLVQRPPCSVLPGIQQIWDQGCSLVWGFIPGWGRGFLLLDLLSLRCTAWSLPSLGACGCMAQRCSSTSAPWASGSYLLNTGGVG